VSETVRQFPQSLEAERAVLGGLLLDHEQIPSIAEVLEPEDFYREAHGKLFRVMIDRSEKGEPLDVLGAADHLIASGEPEAYGGVAYVTSLPEQVPVTENLAYYANLVKDKSIRRRLLLAMQEISEQAYGKTSDLPELLDFAESRVFKVSQQQSQRDWSSLGQVLDKEWVRLEKLSENRSEISGTPTGFADLDKTLAGLHDTDLLILAARPAMGKTALALNISQNVALRGGVGVGIFSLEMSRGQLAVRMLCAEARVDAGKVRTGFLSRERDWPKLIEASETLYHAPLWIEDTPGLTITQVRSKARRLKAEHPELGLIMIDYLQLMQGAGGAKESREQAISSISRGLKGLAKELELPVIALSQLNRGVESRPNKRPMVSDLRECVTGDTLVVLADGRRVPIRELVGMAPEVLAMSSDGRIVTASSDKVWAVGRRPIYRVRLASGRALRATGRHRVYADHRWCRVDELDEGARVALARELPEPTVPDEWPDSRVILLGQLIGDGSYLKGQPMRYTTSSEENSRAVTAAAREGFIGVKVSRHAGRRSWHQLVISGNGNRWHPAGVNLWLRELGIFDQRSHEKRIPDAAFRLGNRQIALLLRHLWAADGALYTPPEHPRSGCKVYYSTNSPGLAGDVAALLLRLGIVARTYTVSRRARRDAHHVTVSGADQQRRFLEIVGAFGPRVPQAEALARRLETLASNTNADTLPIINFERVRAVARDRGISQRQLASLRGTAFGGSAHFSFSPSRAVLTEYAEILDDEVLRQRAGSDLFWDMVVSVEPCGEEEVFDLTVPGPASWLADGLVSHNSGAIEQDADIIMFIYRDEYYNPETEEPGVAEVIVAKQRNGPTGTVKLAFLGQFTRFENLAHNRDVPGGYA
jgi:replicative DNA helicase